MHIIDLTMPIADHVRWKVDRRLVQSFRQGDQFQITWAGWAVHGFTHLDSPRHMIADGPTTDSIPLEQVVGECAVLDLRARVEPGRALEAADLAGCGGHVRQGDLALLKTGWDERRSAQTREFWTDAPYLTRGAAEWLLEAGVKAVAFDFPQDYPIRLLLDGEVAPISEYVTHDVLLRRGVVLIEYVCNATAITGDRTFICALPLKLPDSDGAPTRVVAFEDL